MAGWPVIAVQPIQSIHTNVSATKDKWVWSSLSCNHLNLVSIDTGPPLNNIGPTLSHPLTAIVWELVGVLGKQGCGVFVLVFYYWLTYDFCLFQKSIKGERKKIRTRTYIKLITFPWYNRIINVLFNTQCTMTTVWDFITFRELRDNMYV